jgi:pimeloyl-ACP methyl ester carboxylesterase
MDVIDDDTVTLPDGRHLAYTSIGRHDGPVVVYHHGAPGGRLELTTLDGDADAAGVRIVTPDRPGYGGSSPQPGRTTAEFVDDTAALADHLGVGRFGVMGLSSGGPYAVACASLLGDRVLGAVVAAGNTDMSWPDAADGYLPSELELMALGDTDAATTACAERYGADGSGFFGGEMDLGATDNAWLADHANISGLFASMGAAFAQGVVGYAHDIWVQGRAWSFDAAAIECEVIVVHGDDDQLVPVAHSRHTASLIPGAELRLLPGVGHLSLVDHLPALAAEIIRSSR